MKTSRVFNLRDFFYLTGKSNIFWVECRIGSLYSVFTPFFPWYTISNWVYFHFLCLTFISIVDWMKQGWFCESHLWTILIGQSDIVKVITFLSIPNVLFTQSHIEQITHLDLSKPGKSGFLVIPVDQVILMNQVFWRFWWIWLFSEIWPFWCFLLIGGLC